MIRNWKMLGMPTILATALVMAPPARAVDSDQPAAPIQPNAHDTLEALKEQVKDLTRALEDFKSMKTDLEQAEKRTNLAFARVAGDVQAMRQQIADLRRELDDLKKRAGSTTISGYAANGAGSGRVRMINHYAEQITVVVNDKFYKVEPGQTRLSEPIAAGTFTYEVLGVQSPRTRTVAADGTFTFEVHPQGS